MPARRKDPLDFSSMTWEELNRIPNRVINQLTRSQLKQFWKRQDELRNSTPEALERKKKLQEYEEQKRALDKELEESERRMDELWGLPSTRPTKAGPTSPRWLPGVSKMLTRKIQSSKRILTADPWTPKEEEEEERDPWGMTKKDRETRQKEWEEEEAKEKAELKKEIEALTGEMKECFEEFDNWNYLGFLLNKRIEEATKNYVTPKGLPGFMDWLVKDMVSTMGFHFKEYGLSSKQAAAVSLLYAKTHLHSIQIAISKYQAAEYKKKQAPSKKEEAKKETPEKGEKKEGSSMPIRKSSRRLRTRMGIRQGPSHLLSRLEWEKRMWELQEENGMAASSVGDNFDTLAPKIAELADLEMLEDMLQWVDATQDLVGRFNRSYNNFVANVKAQDQLDRQYSSSGGPNVEGSTHTAISSEPVQRAYERMDDAARRGGLKGLVDAIARRIQVTRDPYKMEGIVVVLDDLIGDLQDLRKAAQRKQ